MIYGSVCSGIEAATVAWHPLGWKPAFFSEIEKFPREVLAHHYPSVPLHGDFTTIKKGEYEPIELLVGGTPCQSFSIAGLRKGLDDPRGNLMLEFGSLAKRLHPKWIVWENVPGVLSSNGGRDFGAFLGMLGELGYGFAYRVLDAQYFGVAQRRRRVFVVGCLGDWRSAAAVLFERDSLSGDPAPSRKAREETAGTIGARTCRSIGAQDADCGHLIGWPAQVAQTLNASFGSKQGLEDQHIRGGQDCSFQVAKCLITKTRMDAETENLIPTTGGHFSYGIPGNWIGRKPENGGNAVEPMVEVSPCQTKTDRHGVCYPMNTQVITRHEALGEGTGFGLGSENDPAFTLSKAHSHAVAFDLAQITSATNRSRAEKGLPAGTLSKNSQMHVAQLMQVRRLTPVECERLQGFPDNYTDIKPNGKPTPDGPRYKALGNSMAVPVMRWIGERIEMVENMK